MRRRSIGIAALVLTTSMTVPIRALQGGSGQLRDSAVRVLVISIDSRVDSKGSEEFTALSERDEPISSSLPSASDYIRSPDFIGTDEIAGLLVYRLRGNREDGSWVELSYSPKVGLIPLRIVDHRSDGSEHRRAAVEVELREK